VRNALYLGWRTPKGKAVYYADEPKTATHVPYCVGTIATHQHDVIMHSFELTAEGRKLPAVILRTLAAHPNVWWDGDDESILRE
jgi:hypothetical protein